ncbi:hypothetical protein VTJ83DRAFT_1079 [Remersonia thermophila]|uniref:PLD phosphodiesterase domain-containing protein n=1 Tax=Remersonia thermophila TaxID=72144 RepID=A0ABR4DMZ2_9PEZI
MLRFRCRPALSRIPIQLSQLGPFWSLQPFSVALSRDVPNHCQPCAFLGHQASFRHLTSLPASTNRRRRRGEMADHWAVAVNGDEDEEEALRIAIALSLGEDPGPRRMETGRGGAVGTGSGAGSGARREGGGGDVIDLTLDDEDESDAAGGGRAGGSDRDSNNNSSSSNSTNASLASSSRQQTGTAAMPSKTATSTPPGETGSLFAALGLDRKKMEEERLARLKKRKASELGSDVPSPSASAPPPPPAGPTQRPRRIDVNPWSSLSSSALDFPAGSPLEYKGPHRAPDPPPSVTSGDKVIYANLPYSRPPPPPGTADGRPKGRTLGSSSWTPASVPQRETPASRTGAGGRIPGAASAASPRTAATATAGGEGGGGSLLSSSSSSSSSSTRPLPFPRGVVKKTWAYGQPRRGDDIKIEEVLQRDRLQLAVLSSFQWDGEWLLSKIDISRTKLILVAYAAGEEQQEQMRANVPGERIRFCFPPMQKVGSMHSKLMLLKFDGYIRIVVPTGNLVSYDWGETGTMENLVFIIDLPKLQPGAEATHEQNMTPFAEELFYFLGEQGLDGGLIASLRHYDFLETSRYRFVHTIPGFHASEDAWKRTGYCGLGRAVNSLGLGTPDPIELDIVCASLGNLKYDFMAAMYYACQGDSGLKEYDLRTSKGQQQALREATAAVKAHTRIFFPSIETVRASRGGKDGAGTICFQSRWWEASTFPRELLRDCENVRPGVLMHSKMIFVRPHNAVGGSGSSASRSFAYVGSANLSESAWGRLVKDGRSGRPKMMCRNWECGVLVPANERAPAGDVKSDAAARGGGSSPNSLQAVFNGVVPVPMEWPGREYVTEGGGAGSVVAMTPWLFS